MRSGNDRVIESNIKKMIVTVSSVILLLFHALTGYASGSVVVDRVIAVVNEEIITMSDLQREAEKLRGARMDDRLLLEEMINKKLQLAAAKKSGMDVSDKEVDDAIEDIKLRNNMTTRELEAELAKEGMSLERYRAELKEQMTLSRVFNKYVRSGIALDEAEIRDYYERNKKSFVLPEEIRVRQIFLRIPERATPAEIASIRNRARDAFERASKGEDFIKLVREFSDGMAGGDDGDLGFMQRDHVLPEIAQLAESLQPGMIAGPVQSSQGFHIIRLEGVRTPVKPFEQVKDEIANIILKQKIEISYRAWLQSLRRESHIENRL